MSKTIKDQIKKLTEAIADPKNAALVPDLELKKQELIAQLPTEQAKPVKTRHVASSSAKAKKVPTKKPTTTKLAVTKKATPKTEQPVKMEITATNPFAQQIANAKTALQSRALDADSRKKIEDKLADYERQATAWEKKQAKPKFIKSTDKDPVKKSNDSATEPEMTEVVIGSEKYKLDECQKKYIKWYNETYLNK